MARHAGGRPRKVLPEDLAAAVDRMIENYQATGDVTELHDYKLLTALNISPRTLDKYYDGEADREKAAADASAPDNDNNISSIMQGTDSTKVTYCDAIKKLVSFRQLACVQHMTGDRMNTGWIFLAKQTRFGGFQDVQRQEHNGKQEISITIAGPDGKGI